MKDDGIEARKQVLAKLSQSREELRALLDPPRPEKGADGQTFSNGQGSFPRSRTMQMLMSSRGLGAVGALAGGLLISRPALALRLLKMVPATAVGKMLVARLMSGIRGKSRDAAH